MTDIRVPSRVRDLLRHTPDDDEAKLWLLLG